MSMREYNVHYAYSYAYSFDKCSYTNLHNILKTKEHTLALSIINIQRVLRMLNIFKSLPFIISFSIEFLILTPIYSRHICFFLCLHMDNIDFDVFKDLRKTLKKIEM